MAVNARDGGGKCGIPELWNDEEISMLVPGTASFPTFHPFFPFLLSHSLLALMGIPHGGCNTV